MDKADKCLWALSQKGAAESERKGRSGWVVPGRCKLCRLLRSLVESVNPLESLTGKTSPHTQVVCSEQSVKARGVGGFLGFR